MVSSFERILNVLHAIYYLSLQLSQAADYFLGCAQVSRLDNFLFVFVQPKIIIISRYLRL